MEQNFNLDELKLMSLVQENILVPHHLRLAKNGKLLSDSLYTDVVEGKNILSYCKIQKLFRTDKVTLIFESLEEYFPCLSSYVRESKSRHPDIKFHIAAYLTPPNSQGFQAHWDLMDVLMLQISGEKKWKVWNPIYRNPFYSADQLNMNSVLEAYCASTKPCMEVDLAANYALFLPRGFIHAGESNSTSSLHLSVGFRPPTIKDCLAKKGELDQRSEVLMLRNKDRNFYQSDEAFLENKNYFELQLERSL